MCLSCLGLKLESVCGTADSVWLCSAVSRIRSYVYDSHRVRFFPVKVYERYAEERLLSVCSKQRNESFFARLNVVALIFCLFIFVSIIIPCQVRSKYIFGTKCISNTKTISACQKKGGKDVYSFGYLGRDYRLLL